MPGALAAHGGGQSRSAGKRDTDRPDVGPYTVRLPGYASDLNTSSQDSYSVAERGYERRAQRFAQRNRLGISKSGNPRLRTAMVELAWLWLRHQADTALSRWFHERVRDERSRVRRVAIVALARKRLVALWRFVTGGVIPEGAVLKAA